MPQSLEQIERRDRFAGQALVGLLSNSQFAQFSSLTPTVVHTENAEVWAAAAYVIADAMLAQVVEES